MRCFLPAFSHKLHRTHCSLGAIRYGLCHLQQTAGAVSGGEQAGHGGRAVGVRPDARAVERRAELCGRNRALPGGAVARRTRRRDAQRFSPSAKRHARRPVSPPSIGADLAGFRPHRPSGKVRRCALLPFGQERDRACATGSSTRASSRAYSPCPSTATSLPR